MAESYPISGEASTPAPTPAYYAVIPADVRYHPDLPPNAKLLYGEITALCHKEGYCWATNQYFADLYAVKVLSVKRWIGALVEAGFIETEVNAPAGNTRRIYLVSKFIRPGIKNDTRPYQKRYDPRIKKDTPNNTENKTMNRSGSPAALSEDEQAAILQGVAQGRAAFETARKGKGGTEG